MRILLAGDSLALPRPHDIKAFNSSKGEELLVRYEDTYGHLLQKSLQEKYPEDDMYVINRAQRFFTIKSIHSQFFDHLYYFQPDIILLQAGVVDCWFRPELKGKQMVGINEFSALFANMIKAVNAQEKTKVIIIGICPTSEKMEKQYPGVQSEISKYNSILKAKADNKQVFYVDMEKHIDPQNPHVYLHLDDHHLNRKGNDLVFSELYAVICAMTENIKGSECYNNEGDLQKALAYFKQSFEQYPHYIDNLFNLIDISYMKQDWSSLETYIEAYKKTDIYDKDIQNIIDMYDRH